MSEISKPDYRYIWASGGANVLPSTVKLQTGWTSEVPPYQWENALQNRQDNMLVHINQHGLPQWDALTEYFANKSYTLGSDGLVYKAVQDSGPNTVTQDPTTDTLDTYWTIAFASPGAFITQSQGDIRYLQVLNNGSDINNAATFRTNIGVVDIATATAYSPGYFYGFMLTNNSVSPNTTIDVAPGAARDSLDGVNIKLTSILRGILQSSGAWAAGDNQNKLDTSAKANSSKYHVFAIRKTSDGTADILFSLSATAPTMPAGYSGFRRLGTVFTDAAGNIRGFLNTGNLFVFKTPVVDINTASAPTDGTYTMTLPNSVNVRARIAATCYNSGDAAVAVNSPSAAKINATSAPASYVGGSYISTSSVDNGGWEFVAMAENAQLVFSATGYLRVTTLGYEEIGR